MIQEVIYQLKHEYGKKATFTRKTSFSTDIDSGNQTVSEESIIIRKAIKLENHFRQAIIRALSAERAGYQLAGDFQIIIDRRDLKGQTININDSVTTEFGAGEIVKVDDFDAALIVSVKR